MVGDVFPNRTYGGEAVSPGTPSLAVEVLSDGNTAAEMRQKRQEFFASGTPLVWEVDLVRRIVTVFTAVDAFVVATAADVLTGDPVLPGFVLPVRDIFADDDIVTG